MYRTLGSIGHWAPRLAAGEVSPLELLEACWARIEAAEKKLKAFITLTPHGAEKAAQRAAREIQAGHYRGPLHGIPVAIKDNLHMAGVPTTAGSRVLAGFVPPFDAAVTTSLRRAGAVIMGKTNLHEFAYGATGENHWAGTTTNPWDDQRLAGGSSGGSAAAVAAGFCLAAVGTDTAGSVRIPAALCGVTGLKPTYGRISRWGMVPLAVSLDTVGLITQNAADAGLLLSALSGPHGKDASSAGPTGFQSESCRTLAGVRFGLVEGSMTSPCDVKTGQIIQEVALTLQQLGAKIVSVDLPSASAVEEDILVPIMSYEASRWHRRWLRQHPQLYGRDVLGRLTAGLHVNARDYHLAQRRRHRLVAKLSEVFHQCDLLLSPTVPVPAPVKGTRRVEVGGRQYNVTNLLSVNTALFNVTGWPSLSLPLLGKGGGQLPVGLMLTAPPWAEAVLLQTASVFSGYTKSVGLSPRLS